MESSVDIDTIAIDMDTYIRIESEVMKIDTIFQISILSILSVLLLLLVPRY